MTLSAADVFAYRLPMRVPVRAGAGRNREGLLVRLAGADGGLGWGEIAPLEGFSPETLEEATAELLDWLASPCCAVEGLLPSVQCGLEQALENIGMQPRGLPQRTSVTLGGLLQGSRQQVLSAASAFRSAGYRAVKLKVGRGDVDAEIGLVRALRRALGPDIGLRLDANRAWTTETAAAFAAGTRGARIDYIEEPLTDMEGLRELALSYGVPVALDESLVGKPHGWLSAHAYARAVVLKPMLLGGAVHVLRWAEEAARLGIAASLSSAFETGIGISGLVYLAARLPENQPAGLDTYRLLEKDIVCPRLDLTASTISPAAASLAGRRVETGMLRKL